MKLLILSASFFLGLLSEQTFAQKSQNVVTFENIKNTQIDIQCLNIDLKVIHDSTTPHLKIGTQVFDGQKASSDSEWSISVQKDPIKEAIKIQCLYPSKVFLDKTLQSQFRYYIILRGPSTELNVNARLGKVALTGWKQPAHIVVEEGTITTDDTSSPMKLNVIKGAVEVKKHTGRLNAEAFEGKLSFNGVDGNMNVTNFTGATHFKSVNGDINLNTRSGSAAVADSGGSFKFDADQGKLDLQSFKGSIEGASETAIITAKLANPARFRAKIKNATVRLSVPSSSGAQVYFALTEGQFQAPSYLNKDEYGSTKTLKGTLRGGESGRLSVTGEAGRIHLTTF